MAQPGRARALGARCRGFKSRRPDCPAVCPCISFTSSTALAAIAFTLGNRRTPMNVSSTIWLDISDSLGGHPIGSWYFGNPPTRVRKRWKSNGKSSAPRAENPLSAGFGALETKFHRPSGRISPDSPDTRRQAAWSGLGARCRGFKSRRPDCPAVCPCISFTFYTVLAAIASTWAKRPIQINGWRIIGLASPATRAAPRIGSGFFSCPRPRRGMRKSWNDASNVRKAAHPSSVGFGGRNREGADVWKGFAW